MKQYLGIGIVIGLIALGAYLTSQYSEPVTVVSDRPEYGQQEEVITEPEYPAEGLEEAEAARDAVIQKRKLEAERDALIKSRAQIQERINEIEKTLGVYWRDPANIRRLIIDTFPEDPHTALAIVQCESGFNPRAHNGSNTNGTTDGGLWQINDVHNSRLQALGLDRYNPEDATKFARMLYEQNGWRDWVCYWHPDHLAMGR